MLLDVAREFGLVIYDRNFGSGASEFTFPERFQPHIRGRLPYTELARVYRQHRAFLNVNSVIDSPTMLSRRVYELLASATPVVSTPSLAIEAIFGGLVFSVGSPDDARRALEVALSDAGWLETADRGRRFILRHHTYAHRLLEVARAAGIEVADVGRDAVSWLMLDASPGDVAATVELLRRSDLTQVRQVIVGVTDGADVHAIGSQLRDALPTDVETAAEVVAMRDVPQAFASLARLARHPWVLVARPEEHRADVHAIGDLLDAVAYAQADVLACGDAGASGAVDQAYVEAVDPKTAVIRADLVRQAGWDTSPASSDTQANLRREGYRFFSTGLARVATVPSLATG
jgi:hypothetical protein